MMPGTCCCATVCGGIAVSLGLLYLLNKLLSGRTVTSVRDKVVLITGASSGLGEACAHAFYEAGAAVILCARRVPELERVKADLLAKHTANQAHEPKVLALDLADLKSIPGKSMEALGLLGRVDILVNNGGISYRGEIIDTDLDVDVKVMTVNYFGQVALTKALLPHMLERRSGHIVAVSSLQGKLAIPFRSAYAASKHALQAFCDTLRAEVADHSIGVSVVSPGYVRTSLSVNAVTGDGSQYGAMDDTTAQGMSPEFVAQEIIRAAECDRKDMALGKFFHVLAIYLRAILPDIYFAIMKHRARKQRLQNMKNK